MEHRELIQRKRDGEELPAGELRELVLGYARGDVPDYQMAAFCMAVFFRGMELSERVALTRAMRDSGRVLVRYSGTQSICRVMVESMDPVLTQRLAESLAELVKREIG